jgi:DNA-binding MarR family transcriptional regulator
VAGRVETLEAINDVLASATIFANASSQLLAAELQDVAGDRLTFTQLKLLRLVERQGQLSVGDVAAFLGVSTAAASKAVDRLVRAGFVGRAEAASDRRTTEVSATPEGRRLLQEFEAASSAALLRLLSTVPVPQLRDLTGRLDRLSVVLASGEGRERSVCFRCGLFFREECLLRDSTDNRCYLQLGTTRRGGGGRAGSLRAKSGDRADVTMGGNG